MYINLMYTKYPKTFHLPWSPGLQNDDRRFEHIEHLRGKRLVVTEKMDGENTSLYADRTHARSIDSIHHVSRDWVKSFHGTIAHEIPNGWRICGENLYAKHSIGYNNLPSYFMAFSVWDDTNTALSWDDTVMFCTMLNIHTVPVLWRGPFEEFIEIHGRFDQLASETVEGYVVRVEDAFAFAEFEKSVAKYVRKNHVQTDVHWMRAAVVPNKLKDDVQ